MEEFFETINEGYQLIIEHEKIAILLEEELLKNLTITDYRETILESIKRHKNLIELCYSSILKKYGNI